MNREIKFRQRVNNRWHYWGFGLMGKGTFTGPLNPTSPSFQFTELKDCDGVDIYEGDVLNVCFTTSHGEYLHDCVYVAERTEFGGIQFRFIRLLWESYDHNQYPIHSYLCERYDTLDIAYDLYLDRCSLVATTDSYTNRPVTRYPFNENEVRSFCSRYFKVIGNIYDNPELLGK